MVAPATEAGAKGSRFLWDRKSGKPPKALTHLELTDDRRLALAGGALVFFWVEGALGVECAECGGAFVLDFAAPGLRRALGASYSRDPLYRAFAKVTKGALVVDATLGFASDSLRLAAWGWRVRSFEQSFEVLALVEDARKRASEETRLREALSRWVVQPGFAATNFAALGESERAQVAAVYLDPMFPDGDGEKRRRKELCLLNHMAKAVDGGQPNTEAGLFAAALALAPERIVVKRPLKARALAPRVAVDYRGKSHRFDVYIRGVSY